MLDYTAVKTKFEEAGQSHVFSFFDALSSTQQQELLSQLEKIDPTEVNSFYKKAIELADSHAKDSIEPLPAHAFDSAISSPEKIPEWEKVGMDLIARNKVAVLLLAGGQGTRLGSSDPKGCYNIGLPSGKSLFQLQAERLRRLETIAQESSKSKVVIPWYIMTSGPTRSATEEFFKSKNYFGLLPDNVFFFNQGTLPCLTNDGKIILEDKAKVAVSPDGNGGIYPALRKEGVIENMAKRGIEYIHSYCVDNCLVRVADPVFIGYSVNKGAECGAKVVPKVSPAEAVGVICVKNDKFSVVEYSEIDAEMASRTDKKTGKLAFGAGNICNHFYTLPFLQRMVTIEKELGYHIARKKIKFIDLQSGEKVTPSSPNGIKLEAFVFDVFPFTQKFAVLEVDRQEEFSPLKNAPGSATDGPETSRRDIIAQHVRFVERAGGKVIGAESGATDLNFEISPLVSYSGEGLKGIIEGKALNPAYIDSLETLKGCII
ncbi:UDP-N-acetylglucosamine pyrophosphorylase [Massospora cicadina]|nr:UDP-N-acetylglucosamine pyrophosphorylase [Massospora cicadina]